MITKADRKVTPGDIGNVTIEEIMDLTQAKPILETINERRKKFLEHVDRQIESGECSAWYKGQKTDARRRLVGNTCTVLQVVFEFLDACCKLAFKQPFVKSWKIFEICRLLFLLNCSYILRIRDMLGYATFSLDMKLFLLFLPDTIQDGG